MKIGYFIKEGFHGLSRAALSSFVSVVTIALALSLLSIFLIVSSNIAFLISDIRSRVELEAYLDKSLSQKQNQKIGERISRIEGVASVQFISKDEAARVLKSVMGEQDIFDLVENNPLPASYKIKLKEDYRTNEALGRIAPAIEAIDGVEEVNYQKEMLKALDEKIGMYQQISLYIGLATAVVAIFLISNTIKLSIYSKRDLIKTMKLVGATNRFIASPFIVEGVVQGILGGIIAAALAYGFYHAAREFLLTGIVLDVRIPGVLILTGIVLGWLGSVLSVRFFLKERIQDR